MLGNSGQTTKRKFTATDAQAEKLKGTEGKDLKAKYIITERTN